MATNKMKVWPGPRLLVPMATDILLIGEDDVPTSLSDGIQMSSTKTNYLNMFLNGTAGAEPFNVLITNAKEFIPGAHIMWTLPHALRKGHQVKDDQGNVHTAFPEVPNRWLITRFEYKDLKKGTIPTVEAQIVKSDELSTPDFPPGFNQSLYPQQIPDSQFPASTIGTKTSLSQWDGNNLETGKKASIKAVGPGVMSWSVLYDNIQNVFSLVDETMSEDASFDTPYYYTYSILGWYADPDNDLLQEIETAELTNLEWEEKIKSDFKWVFSKDNEDDNSIDDAITAWDAWKKAHGLDGTFDPGKLDLPAQAKAAIVSWEAHWKANGEATTPPELARQLMCHSMVGTVEWMGTKHTYGSGNPLAKTIDVPKLTVGATSVDAISTYMAREIQENSGSGQSPTDIPTIARALSAFQQDLLDDLAEDPVKIENQLHTTSFSKTSAGSEWIVALEESNPNPTVNDPPSTSAGKQSIPLKEAQTEALTQLNLTQSQHNALVTTNESQQAELFRLLYKQYLIDSTEVKVSDDIENELLQSIKALTNELTSVQQQLSSLATDITNQKDSLQTALGSEYELKDVALSGFATTIDPVIAVAGALGDTKLTSAVVNLNTDLLVVRYTGQTISGIVVPALGTYPSVTIGAEELLAQINMPAWNAYPKEALDIWVETLFLDTSMAATLAVIFFEKNDVPPNVYNKPVGADRKTPLDTLTATISKRQSLIWNDPDEVEHSHQAMANAAGLIGVVPSEAGVAFRKLQPWTPIFMDWKVKWYPTSIDATDPFKGWDLGEIDYFTKNNVLQEDGSFLVIGRSILNPNIAINIQERLAPLKDDPLDQFPPWLQVDLHWASRQAGTFDILTQTISGFNNKLITKLSEATLFLSTQIKDDNKQKQLLEDAIKTLGKAYESFTPQLGQKDYSKITPGSEQYAPIRSGHITIIDVNIIDAYGQVMPAKLDQGGNVNAPIPDILWSEALMTDISKQVSESGKLAPRLLQPTKVKLDLLQGSTTEKVLTNSADSTSPICGWVMANHLDNSLMVFDSSGNNLGAVIRVQTEDNDTNWSIRWDAAPGTVQALGAPPNIENDFLAGFIHQLLKTGYTGAGAYDDLMLAIDSTLWTMSTYKQQQNGNLSLLLGRPIAIVRAQVGLQTGGDPIYKQFWCNTGEYYNQKGKYVPEAPPYMKIPFKLRVGDAYLRENGVFGFFVENKYDSFYPVYGANGQTKALMELLRAGKDLDWSPSGEASGYTSDYIKKPPLTLNTTPDADSPIELLLLVDSEGSIPVFAGCLPMVSKALPNGPVTNALTKLTASFRIGPILLAPDKIQMPSPAEVRGKWSWIAKKDTTSWSAAQAVSANTSSGELHSKPIRLQEGWLNLSNFEETQDK